MEYLDGCSIDMLPFVNLTEKWFQGHLLSEQSIHIRWISLIQSMNIREMELYRCLNCHQYTHIINRDSNEIFLNEELLVSTKGRISLMESFAFLE